jgi:site-specific DNA-methyltransferase (adenine-specific)
MSKTKLLLGDNIQSLQKLPDNSVDSIVTDPPYGLSFMGKKWDYDVPSVEFWKEVYRVLKPGGHVLSFGGTRTYHRMVVNIEDAGFEIRDQIMWLYGSGFPKSHNIGKAVDKLQGNDREVVGVKTDGAYSAGTKNKGIGEIDKLGGKEREVRGEDFGKITKGQSPYEGWGTALKPANEPICVARKPLSEKSVAENVLKWGTGGINIDGCRVGSEIIETNMKNTKGGLYNLGNEDRTNEVENTFNEGRFPANIILDEIAGELLDEQSGLVNQGHWPKGSVKGFGDFGGGSSSYEGVGKKDKTKSGASRFFYQAKVSKAERNMGLDEFEDKVIEGRDAGQDERAVAYKKRPTPTKNVHPTVKPVALMAYLCRLITPPNGIVLDPFMGSGSTGIAARLEGFKFCGMEMDKDYFKIAESRIENFEEYRKFIK